MPSNPRRAATERTRAKGASKRTRAAPQRERTGAETRPNEPPPTAASRRSGGSVPDQPAPQPEPTPAPSTRPNEPELRRSASGRGRKHSPTNPRRRRRRTHPTRARLRPDRRARKPQAPVHPRIRTNPTAAACDARRGPPRAPIASQSGYTRRRGRFATPRECRRARQPRPELVIRNSRMLRTWPSCSAASWSQRCASRSHARARACSA